MSSRRPLLAALSALAATVLLPAASHAAVVASGAISFPATVTVGQVGLPASIMLANADTGPDAGDVNAVCNAGDSSLPCAGDRGIVLVPACGVLSPGGCALGGADPGVFGISSTAIGRAGSSCQGVAFGVLGVDPTLGSVRFTPLTGANVLLPGSGATCAIDFTVAVLRCPAADASLATPGIQTGQVAEHTQFAAFAGQLSDHRVASSETTVNCGVVNHPPSCASVSAPTTLWPPNHKFRLIALSGGTDPDGDPVTITITGVTQDEPLDGLGDGDTAPDAKLGTASNEVFLRAERSGLGDGRVYRIAFQGSDGHGGTCTGSVAVGVPHDQGNGSTPIDSGQTVNSFGP
jgi:hypothetical protein